MQLSQALCLCAVCIFLFGSSAPVANAYEQPLPRPAACQRPTAAAELEICTVTTSMFRLPEVIYQKDASGTVGSGSGAGTCAGPTHPSGAVSLSECLSRVGDGDCGGTPQIFFDVAAMGTTRGQAVIKLLPSEELPSIATRCTVIDGYSGRSASATSKPPVVIDGSAIPRTKYVNGISVQYADSEGVVIRGLEIRGFPESGIAVGKTAPDVAIEACWLVDNSHSGIYVQGPRVRIGSVGDGPDGRNVISGNDYAGILLANNAHGAMIENTFVGVTPTGMRPWPNLRGIEFAQGVDGVSIGSAHSNRDTMVVVSGNHNNGVSLWGSNALVVAAYVGVAVDGTTAIPNGLAGIFINGPDNTIGGPTSPAVIVSGNLREGITCDGSGARIVNTVVGLGADGTTPVPNGWDGILVSSGDVVIGDADANGSSAADARVISSGNTYSGLRIGPRTDSVGVAAAHARYDCAYTDLALPTQAKAVPTVDIAGAYFGLDRTGLKAVPNRRDGVTVQVGRSVRASGCVISGNAGNGITVGGAAQTDIHDTIVGLSADGKSAMGNQQFGVVFGESASTSNTISATTISASAFAAIGEFRSKTLASLDWATNGFANSVGRADTFQVNNPSLYEMPALAAVAVASDMDADAYRNSTFFYEIGETYVITYPHNFTHATGDITFDVICVAGPLAPEVDRHVRCPADFYMDGTGNMTTVSFTPAYPHTGLTVRLIATDARLCSAETGDGEAVAAQWQLATYHADTRNSVNGPNGLGCENGGVPIDTVKFDSAFSCNCSGTVGFGENCENYEHMDQIKSGAESTQQIIWVSAGSAVAVIVAVLLAATSSRRLRAYIELHRPAKFSDLFAKMVEAGDIQLQADSTPSAGWREISRKRLTMLNRVGSGAFGEVWKALLDEQSSRGTPEYTVAAKTVLNPDATPEAAEELLSEAAVMMVLGGHKNLVSIIGVVTSGRPYILVLSYCEHGSLRSVLRERAANENPLSMAAKMEMAAEVACGMDHLSGKRFIHRDLAARNVLLASGRSSTGMVCKVADFGLSRGNTTNTNKADDAKVTYYSTRTGKFPVRWTAPEAMSTGKYTPASDVWSFGILVVEMLLDGETPYSGIKGNQSVINFTTGGGRHFQPDGCSAMLYGLLLECWAQDATDRPSFADLAKAINGFQLPGSLASDQSDSLGLNVYKFSHSSSHPSGGGSSESYTSDAYRQGQLVQNTVARRGGLLLRDLDLLEDRAKEAEASLTQYEPEYEQVAQTWCGTAWTNEMQVVADQAQRSCTAELAGAPLSMPNPWRLDGIETTSIRYLNRLYSTYEGSEDPFAAVVSVCTRIVETWFDASEIRIELGPLKKRDRVFEKVLLKRGDFAAIFDYARLSFVISNPARVPALLAKLCTAPEFSFVRIKNRLDPTVSAYESGGYRDCQCLVRLPSGWVVELQLIPAEIYAVRKRCGHAAYKEQRFVLEGRKIAHSVGGCQQPARPRAILCGPTAATVSLDQHLYEYAAAVWANATHPPPTYLQSITSDEGNTPTDWHTAVTTEL